MGIFLEIIGLLEIIDLIVYSAANKYRYVITQSLGDLKFEKRTNSANIDRKLCRVLAYLFAF